MIREKYFLPLEIWEEILSILIANPKALLSASKVCVQWRHLATRICEKFCSSKLDAILLKQLSETEVTHRKCKSFIENDDINVLGDEWINRFWLFQETSLDAAVFEERLILGVFDSTINITTADPYLLISTYNKLEHTTTIHLICSTGFPFSEDSSDEIRLLINSIDQVKKTQVDGKVLQVCLLILPTPVLLLVASTYMKAIVVPSGRTCLGLEILDTKPRIKGHSKTSSEGNYFLTQDTEAEDLLYLYKASLPEAEHSLEVTLISKFKTIASPYSWKLSRGLIKTMETSGHIRVYNAPSLDMEDAKSYSSEVRDYEMQLVLCAESEMKKDLRYPNPTLFTQDLLFSSTIVSRVLLEYWHMDRDRDFWLIGNISPDLKKDNSTLSYHPINLHKVVLGKAAKQEVTAVIFQRGLLLCGTEEGHILGYNLQKNMSSMEKEGFSKLHDLPWLNITGVASSPIVRLGTLFTPLGLLLAVGEDSGKCSLVHVRCKGQW